MHSLHKSNSPPPSAGKAPKWHLGVAEPKIGTAIQEGLGVPCNSNDTVAEIVRGIRMHIAHYIPQLGSGNLQKAQLGLAHSYSRAKVKFNVNRSDNMIIQAIALLDQLDKDLNTFAMRVREWYGWHFPELAKLGELGVPRGWSPRGIVRTVNPRALLQSRTTMFTLASPSTSATAPRFATTRSSRSPRFWATKTP